jgi:hypothetical protein
MSVRFQVIATVIMALIIFASGVVIGSLQYRRPSNSQECKSE